MGLHDGAGVRGEVARAPQGVPVHLLAHVLYQLRGEASVQEHGLPARTHGALQLLQLLQHTDKHIGIG